MAARCCRTSSTRSRSIRKSVLRVSAPQITRDMPYPFGRLPFDRAAAVSLNGVGLSLPGLGQRVGEAVPDGDQVRLAIDRAYLRAAA